jgi:hypothetical protein
MNPKTAWSTIGIPTFSMYRTTNTTESIISLGEKLRSHGWNRLNRQDKRRIIANINSVAPFIRESQHVILCEVFSLEYKCTARRLVGKSKLEEKIRQAQLTRRRESASKLNCE